MGPVGRIGRDKTQNAGLLDVCGRWQSVGADADSFLVLATGSGGVFGLEQGLLDADGGWGGEGATAFLGAWEGTATEEEGGQEEQSKRYRRERRGLGVWGRDPAAAHSLVFLSSGRWCRGTGL